MPRYILHGDADRIFQRFEVFPKQMHLDWPIHKTLEERDDLRLVVDRVTHNTTHEVSCVLSISVNVTLILMQGNTLVRFVKFVLDERGNRRMMISLSEGDLHGGDGGTTNAGRQALGCRPFDIAQMGEVFTHNMASMDAS